MYKCSLKNSCNDSNDFHFDRCREIRVLDNVLNIVLVEPQIPQNTGNVARTCSATGARLHLVGPMGFKIDDKKLKRAGLDYWHLLDITYYENIASFFDIISNGLICGNNPYPDTANYAFYYFTTKARKVYSEPSYENNSYLFFGSETKGLDEMLLFNNPEQCVRFPILKDARSLNVSNAVAIGVFEVLRQWGFPRLKNFGKMAEVE